jgi:hypothetical protein
MIKVTIGRADWLRGVRLGDKLKQLGFTRMTGKIYKAEDLCECALVFYCEPTIKDLLFKNFNEDYLNG